MKRILYLFAAFLVASAILLIADRDRRWLLLNGYAAEKYALQLLGRGPTPQLPVQFIDYTVAASNGGVIFGRESHRGSVYGYFPDGEPDPENGVLTWKKLWGRWYSFTAGE